MNNSHVLNFARSMADTYRPLMKEKTLDNMMRIIPRDDTLLNNFVQYAARNGLPARWYYINQSRALLLNQLKAVLARDLVGFDAYIMVLNEKDPALHKALDALESGKSPVNIVPEKKP